MGKSIFLLTCSIFLTKYDVQRKELEYRQHNGWLQKNGKGVKHLLQAFEEESDKGDSKSIVYCAEDLAGIRDREFIEKQHLQYSIRENQKLGNKT